MPAQIAAAWAREYAYPQLVPSTNRAFFERLEEQHGAELETFRGDWADWWADGLGSAAREVGFNRRAQAAVRTAQTLHVMADALTGADPELDWAGEADARLRAHGALRRAHVVRRPPRRPRAHRSRVVRAAVAVEGRARGRGTRSRGGAARGGPRPLPVGAARLDPRAQPERPRAHRPGRALRAGGACRQRAAVLRSSTWSAASGCRTRSARRSRVGTGRRAGCSRSSPVTCRRSATAASSSSRTARRSPRSSQGPSRTSTIASSSTPRAATRSGCVDLELGHDLVDAASAFGFGQVVRDLYGGPLHATTRARPGAELTYAPPDGARSGALILSRYDARRRDRLRTSVEPGRGADHDPDSGRRLRGGRDDLPARARRAEARRLRAAPEARDRREGERSRRLPVRCARPADRLRADRRRRRRPVGPRRRGARPRDPPLGRPPGRRRDRRLDHARRRRSSSSGTSSSRTRRTRRRSTARAPGLVTSWVTNNVWDTNFPPTQGGEVRFDYAVSSAPPAADGRSLGIATADALTRPLVGVLGATAPSPGRNGAASWTRRASRSSCSLRGGRRRRSSTSSRTPRTRSPFACRGRELRIAPGDYVTVPVDSAGVARRYDPFPSYPASGGAVERGLPPAPARRARDRRPSRARLGAPARRAARPAAPSTSALASAVERGRAPHRRRRPRTTRSSGASGTASLADLFGELPRVDEGTRSCSGPGARSSRTTSSGTQTSPKRHALAAVRRGEAPNVGQPRGRMRHGAAAAVRRLAAARPPQAGAAPTDRPLRRPLRARRTALARGRRAPARRSPTWRAARSARVPTFLPGPWGGQWLQRRARHRDGRAEPRVVVRADRARGVDPRRRARGRLRAAAGSRPARRSSAPRSRRASATRSRSVSTTSTRSRAVTSRSSATRPASTRARPSACRTRRTRPTTSMHTTPGAKRLPRPARGRRRRTLRARRAGRARGSRVRARALPAAARRRAAPALPRSRQARRMRAARAMSCSRSARRRTSTRCASTTGCDATSTGTLRPVHLEHAFANLDPTPARRSSARAT